MNLALQSLFESKLATMAETRNSNRLPFGTRYTYNEPIPNEIELDIDIGQMDGFDPKLHHNFHRVWYWMQPNGDVKIVTNNMQCKRHNYAITEVKPGRFLDVASKQCRDHYNLLLTIYKGESNEIPTRTKDKYMLAPHVSDATLKLWMENDPNFDPKKSPPLCDCDKETR